MLNDHRSELSINTRHGIPTDHQNCAHDIVGGSHSITSLILLQPSRAM